MVPVTRVNVGVIKQLYVEQIRLYGRLTGGRQIAGPIINVASSN